MEKGLFIGRNQSLLRMEQKEQLARVYNAFSFFSNRWGRYLHLTTDIGRRRRSLRSFHPSWELLKSQVQARPLLRSSPHRISPCKKQNSYLLSDPILNFVKGSALSIGVVGAVDLFQTSHNWKSGPLPCKIGNNFSAWLIVKRRPQPSLPTHTSLHRRKRRRSHYPYHYQGRD